MAQATEGKTSAADVVNDYDAICRVVQLCTEGEAKGDVGDPYAGLDRFGLPSARYTWIVVLRFVLRLACAKRGGVRERACKTNSERVRKLRFGRSGSADGPTDCTPGPLYNRRQSTRARDADV